MDKKRFDYLSHIPNANKTDTDFEEWESMAKELNYPKQDRNSKERPLHKNKDKVKINKEN